MLEDLRLLVKSTPGLEQCECKIADLLANKGNSASVVLIELLTALDLMPLEAQAAFFKALYNSQESRLQEKLAMADVCMPWMPTLPLVNEFIACDGCNQSPLQGLRFKCKACPDYDLCAKCFTEKSLLHHGECDAHEFEIVTPWAKGVGRGLGKCCGKGFGKCKGKSKGKGKGKGKVFFAGSFNGTDARTEGYPMRPCARAGCELAATWHPTHCCEGCRVSGSQCHGLRCERVPVPVVEADASEEMKRQDHAKSVQQCSDDVFDFTFPVAVEDGRRLTISWNRADDPEQVAMLFLRSMASHMKSYQPSTTL